MTMMEKGLFPLSENALPDKLNILRQKINDEEYILEAIHRIAQVLSNEITGGSGGKKGERKR